MMPCDVEDSDGVAVGETLQLIFRQKSCEILCGASLKATTSSLKKAARVLNSKLTSAVVTSSCPTAPDRNNLR